MNSYISPVINNEFCVNSTNQVIDRLTKYEFTNNSKLVSFDIQSLFTNVPLHETIEIAANKIYDQQNTNKPPYPKRIFKSLLTLATTGIFSFNDQLYKQIDGLSMGSPLAPTLANLFVGHLEEQFLKLNDKPSPFYIRYVDDSLLIFENDDEEAFHNFLNS